MPLFNNSQKGFSALGLFLLGIIMLALMNYSGIFSIPKSEVKDTQEYQVSGSKVINGKGLLMTDLEFATPHPTSPPAPQPTTQPLPTATQGPTATPGPTNTPTPTPTFGPSPTPTVAPIPTATPTPNQNI